MTNDWLDDGEGKKSSAHETVGAGREEGGTLGLGNNERVLGG